VTDAHVITGALRPEAFLGGRMALDEGAARQVFKALADRFGMSVEAMAQSAVRLATANIVRALRRVSTERGRDPRDFVLVPFGGAGPLHAAAIAGELGMDRVLVPPSAGVMSAYGLLRADFAWFESMTRTQGLDQVDEHSVRVVYDEMCARAQARFDAFGLPPPRRFTFVVAARLAGQAFEVDVAFDGHDVDHLKRDDLRARFAGEYERIYTRRIADHEAVELVSYRLGALIEQDMNEGLREMPTALALPPRARVYLDGGWRSCALHSRAALTQGDRVPGPAIVPDSTSTVFVPPAWTACVDAHGNLVLVRGRGGAGN
jgi:N-methylhydantoinase A